MTQQELSEDDYAAVADWATYPGFSDAERVALEYTEKFAIDHLNIDQTLIDRMRSHFDDDLIVEMTIAIGTWIAFGRLQTVLGVEVSCALQL